MRLRNGAYASGTDSRTTWPFTGRTGEDLRRDAGEAAAAAAPRQHHLPGGHLRAVREDRAARPVPGRGQPLRPVDPAPARPHAATSAAASRRGSTWWSPSTRSPPRTPGASIGLEAAALPPAQPFRAQPAALLERVQLPQVGSVVGVQCHGERAARPVADVPPGGVLQFGDEVRVALRRGEVEPQQGLLAVVQLGDRGEHARRDLGGAAAGLGVRHGGAQTPLRRPPGRDQADDPPPMTRTSGVVPALVRDMGVQPSLRRHDPDQVRTVGGGGSLPLSPSAPGSRECVGGQTNPTRPRAVGPPAAGAPARRHAAGCPDGPSGA